MLAALADLPVLVCDEMITHERHGPIVLHVEFPCCLVSSIFGRFIESTGAS